MLQARIKQLFGLLRGYMVQVNYLGKFKRGKRFILGKSANIEIRKRGFITVGDRVVVRRFSSICASSGRIVVGNNVFFNESVMIAAKKSIFIADRTLIGPGVKIYDHDHVYDKNGVYNDYKTDDVIIGHDCWIGANAIILRGSKIGNHVVIGAGCVVQGNIPDNTLITMKRELIMRPLK